MMTPETIFIASSSSDTCKGAMTPCWTAVAGPYRDSPDKRLYKREWRNDIMTPRRYRAQVRSANCEAQIGNDRDQTDAHLGLGRIVALYGRLSTLYQIH